MKNRILDLNKKKSSRRDFFKITGALMCVSSVPTYLCAKSKSVNKKDDFIIIDGWVLKESDIHDL